MSGVDGLLDVRIIRDVDLVRNGSTSWFGRAMLGILCLSGEIVGRLCAVCTDWCDLNIKSDGIARLFARWLTRHESLYRQMGQVISTFDEGSCQTHPPDDRHTAYVWICIRLSRLDNLIKFSNNLTRMAAHVPVTMNSCCCKLTA